MRGETRRFRTWPVAVTVAGALVVGAAVLAARGVGAGFGAENRRAASHDPLPPATAQVTRQTLVDTRTETGDLGYGEATTVTGRLAGTLTALPPVGAAVKRGQALYRVDDTPVVLLYGSLPSYRPLSKGVEGPDVKQFEQNLKALGYSGFTVDEEYSAATAAAVKRWQEDLGLPETGTVETGRVHYAPGPVRVDAQKAAVGDQAGPGTALLTFTGSAREITVDLDVADQRLARTGAAATITLPNGRTARGRITGVRTVVKPAEGQTPAQTKIRVTVIPDDPKVLSGLDQASIDVAFTASKRENVLTVPVAALLALAEGGYGVQVVTGTSTRIVPVRTGLFAGGRVEVSGDGLSEGMTVGMPS